MESEGDSRTRELDIFDIFLLCWIVIAVALASGKIFADWAGKGQYLLTECLILLLGAGYLKLRKQKLRAILRWNTIPPRAVLGMLVVAIGAAPVFDGLDRLVSLIIPLPPEQSESLAKALSPGNSWETILLVLGLGFAAPIAEESLFRGAIQQVIEKNLDVTRGVMFTALLFALIHFRYWWLIQLLLMAVFLGYLAWRWNSIVPPILIHGANNVWSLYLTMKSGTVTQSYFWGKNQVSPLVWAAGITLIIFGLRFSNQSPRVGKTFDE